MCSRKPGYLFRRARWLARHYYDGAIFLFLPNVCNAKCDFCYVRPTFAKSAKLSASCLARLPKLLASLRACGFKEVRLTGGEPLLFANLCSLVEPICHHGMRYTVLTNGLLLGQHLELFLVHRPAKVTVSLHSVARHSSVFGVPTNAVEILDDVAELGRRGIAVTLSIVVQPAETDDVVRTLERAAAAGVQSVKLICVNDPRHGFAARASFEVAVRAAMDCRLPLSLRATDLSETACLLRTRGFLSVTLPHFQWTACCAGVGVMPPSDMIALEPSGVARMAVDSFARYSGVVEFPCSSSIGACPVSLVRPHGFAVEQRRAGVNAAVPQAATDSARAGGAAGSGSQILRKS